jgi:hypothetical protein
MAQGPLVILGFIGSRVNRMLHNIEISQNPLAKKSAN